MTRIVFPFESDGGGGGVRAVPQLRLAPTCPLLIVGSADGGAGVSAGPTWRACPPAVSTSCCWPWMDLQERGVPQGTELDTKGERVSGPVAGRWPLPLPVDRRTPPWVREGCRVVNVSAAIATAVNGGSRWYVAGFHIATTGDTGAKEAHGGGVVCGKQSLDLRSGQCSAPARTCRPMMASMPARADGADRCAGP